jgi:hypothetical protein
MRKSQLSAGFFAFYYLPFGVIFDYGRHSVCCPL